MIRQLGKLFIFFIVFSLLGSKPSPPLVQRAYVTENRAIIYSEPDFDSEQLAWLPQNRVIAVSTRIYRPKNLFGSFYRVFVNKPKKIRGYISEIDIVTQFKKNNEKMELNPVYQEKENILRQVKNQSQISNNPSRGESSKKVKEKISSKKESKSKLKKNTQKKKRKISKKERNIIDKNFIGLIGGWHLPLFGVNLVRSPKFIGVQMIKQSNIAGGLPFDWRLTFSPQSPLEVHEDKSRQGFIIEGHVFPLFSVLKRPDYLFYLGVGIAWKLDHSFYPKYDEQLRLGLGASLTGVIHVFHQLSIKVGVEYNLFFNQLTNVVGVWGGPSYAF